MENVSELFKEAELRKINSETSRNEAEQTKFLTESKEINKRISKEAFYWTTIFKVIIGAIVAAALLAAWSIEYLKPLLEKNQELATLENKILATENKEQLKQIEVSRHELENSKRELELSRQSAKEELTHLKVERDTVYKELRFAVDLIKRLNIRIDELFEHIKKLSKKGKKRKEKN